MKLFQAEKETFKNKQGGLEIFLSNINYHN